MVRNVVLIAAGISNQTAAFRFNFGQSCSGAATGSSVQGIEVAMQKITQAPVVRRLEPAFEHDVEVIAFLPISFPVQFVKYLVIELGA